MNHITVEGRRVYQQMHRLIMKAPKHLVVDHINHDGLDNRRANLRLATVQQNAWNIRKGRYGGKSEYRGVSWNKQAGKWRACIFIDGKQKHIGHWESEREAARAYDREVLRRRGEFGLLNFPPKRGRKCLKGILESCQIGLAEWFGFVKNGRRGRSGREKSAAKGIRQGV